MFFPFLNFGFCGIVEPKDFFMLIERKIAQLLIAQKKTLSVAESCSGGLLCQRLTNIPGSSCFLKLGLVVYSNDAKIKFLKIQEKHLIMNIILLLEENILIEFIMIL